MKRAAVAAVITIAGVGNGLWAADARWMPATSSLPALVENREPELCARVLDSVTRWFLSTSVAPPDVHTWEAPHYVASVGPGHPAQADVTLSRVEDSGMSTVCRVSSQDPDTHLAALRESPEIEALLEAVAKIGGPGFSCGTANSGGRALGEWAAVLRLTAARPWAVRPVRDPATLWRFLADWGAADPWNRREYLALRHAVEPAQRAYAGYLRKAFGLHEPQPALNSGIVEVMVASRFRIPNQYFEEGAQDRYLEPRRPALAQLSRDPGHRNAFGKTSLMMAAHLNRLDVVEQLLDQGADPNAVTQELRRCDDYLVLRGRRTALMYAAENASPRVMKALLDAGAKPDARDGDGRHASNYLLHNPRLTDAEKRLSVVELAARSAALGSAPGFDCARARSRAEKAICGSEALRLLDAEMSAGYSRVRARAHAAIEGEQVRWTKSREAGCDRHRDDDYIDCLAEMTAARQRYLQHLAGE